jgi:glycosyltransferase involved in cell wall biosynthesis
LRILVVAHDFPPLNSSASRRPYSWALAWSRLGHEVHVLTTAKYATDGRADLALDCSGFAVHEVPYLPFAKTGAARSGPSSGSRKPSGAFDLLRRSTRRLRLGMGFFTQTQMLATRKLARRAEVLAAGGRFDFLISTSGPEVCTFAAHAIARRSGTPWIADYRDLWFQEFAIQRYAFTTWATGTLNLRMLRSAAAAVTISEGLASYLEPAVRCPVWVSYNGYLKEAYAAVAPRRWSDGRIHLVYTGNFYPEKRDPEPLFKALAALPGVRERLRLDVFGPDEEWVRARIAANGLQDVVVLHGPVSYQESLAAQRGADALLFIDWMDDRAEGVLTGKLFEYLASGRPTLCVGSRANTEAARIIVDCAVGEVAVDAGAIRAALERIASNAFGAAPDAARIARFSREAQAGGLLQRIEGLLAAR